MPTNNSDFWGNAAEQAEGSIVRLAGSCRRGGTGSVYGTDGLILTTARALSGQDQVEVVLGPDSVPARVIGYDVASDVGLARLESPLGRAPAWAEQPARLGASLLVASRPARGLRVRRGLVAQLGAAWHTPRGARVERYLETDLAPEPGFSGGLAFDSRGLALGMASAALLRGVPLLLEKPTLQRVVAALAAHGRVRRGYLGVSTQAVRLPEALAAARAQPSGLMVMSVQPDSAAERAGLLLGDVLLELSGAALHEPQALQAVLEDAEGTALPLALLRAGQQHGLQVTPGVRP